jgi:hypothetical protein
VPGANPAAAGSPAAAGNGGEAQTSSDELSQLKQRLAELERAVTSIAPGNAAKPKSPAPGTGKAGKRPARKASVRKK